MVLTPAISVAEVGKPPHIAKAYRITHTGQEELHLVGPATASHLFLVLKKTENQLEMSCR
jgi:hypothetical protein